MRKSTPDKPLRMQQALAYTYKGVAVYRSWLAIPALAIKTLRLKKGDELYWEIHDKTICFWQKTNDNHWRKSTNKPIRVQQILAYTYKKTDVYRYWIVVPTKAMDHLRLHKGDELGWELVSGCILYQKLE